MGSTLHSPINPARDAVESCAYRYTSGRPRAAHRRDARRGRRCARRSCGHAGERRPGWAGIPGRCPVSGTARDDARHCGDPRAGAGRRHRTSPNWCTPIPMPPTRPRRRSSIRSRARRPACILRRSSPRRPRSMRPRLSGPRGDRRRRQDRSAGGNRGRVLGRGDVVLGEDVVLHPMSRFTRVGSSGRARSSMPAP